jgi:glutamate N-acetyltransferase/amino-acid N-acetyltransferase
VITNAGNANAFTGIRGEQAIMAYRDVFAGALNIAAEGLLIASTGVIGEVLEADFILKMKDKILGQLGQSSWQEAGEAIRTTDTFAKGATTKVTLSGQTITINGIAKGSGMIAPDMATMLAYLGTDAAISQNCLQTLLSRASDKSFNAITVDSDTSTSDSVYLVATGHANIPQITDPDSSEAAAFFDGLLVVMTDLAQQIVRDGEGAQKFVTINVTGAKDPSEAKKIGLAVANSPLVKTAIAGEDANWGRIVMAVGKSGAEADRDKLQIKIGGYLVAENGAAVEAFDERPIALHMQGQEIEISIDIDLGSGTATIWTCDLTHGYITINGDYRS